MSLRVYDSALAAWHAEVRELVDHGQRVPGTLDAYSIGSGFGTTVRDTLELVGHCFVLADPRQRLIDSPTRHVDLAYAIANVVWTLSGSSNVDSIARYNPMGRRFAGPGGQLSATLGARLYDNGGQLERAAQRLKADPSTRRALVQIYRPSDLLDDTRDASCIGSLHFLARAGRLDCVAYMRSQSAFKVLPYDLFALTMLHEAVAVAAGIELGQYCHFSSSFHLYMDELEHATALAQAGLSPLPRMPAMQPSALEIRQQIVAAEQEIRDAIQREPSVEADARRFALGDYWTDLFHVLILGLKERMGIAPCQQEIESISAPYWRLIS